MNRLLLHLPVWSVWILIGWLVFIGTPLTLEGSAHAEDEVSKGIQPLASQTSKTFTHLVPKTTRTLFLPDELEAFLRDLEENPPPWASLRDPDLIVQSERLFQFNRDRDRARARKTAILHQQLAFLWSGLLRQYDPDHQGFRIALGPTFTETSWGMVRFKPVGIPDYLIAMPSQRLRRNLEEKQKNNQPVEIAVLFIGQLVQDESIIYAFSHDNQEQGLILPVVAIETVQYLFLSPPESPQP